MQIIGTIQPSMIVKGILDHLHINICEPFYLLAESGKFLYYLENLYPTEANYIFAHIDVNNEL